MADLTYDEFLERASAVDGLAPELYEPLYPMVRDLLRMAARVRALAPELHGQIPEDQLSRDARGNA
jgi:hypothetical protein